VLPPYATIRILATGPRNTSMLTSDTQLSKTVAHSADGVGTRFARRKPLAPLSSAIRRFGNIRCSLAQRSGRWPL